ncbi:MAG TPA: PAS domain-containing sensor histidine kinase, partial [Ktedonobacteraceae bacterium]|nr:PAS domain-containing sensor histidine kinase [Ktedonobacteraceae bacterium]
MSNTKHTKPVIPASSETLLHMLETLPEALLVVDDDTRIVYANASAQALAGTKQEDLCGQSLWRCAPHLVSTSLSQAVQKIKQTREPTKVAYASPVTNTWLQVSLSPTDGGLVLFFQHHLEHKDTEDNLHALVDAIPQLVWIMHPDGSSEYGNQRWCDYTTMTFQQYQGDGWLQALHPDDSQPTLTLWRHACDSGEPFEIAYRLKNGHTGTYRWFLARAMPVRDDVGQIVKWFGTCTDIEEQKQAEQKLKASEENLRVLATTVPQMVWASRPDGQHEYANQRWCDYTGLTVEHMQSNRWAPLQCIHPEDQDGTRTLWQHALDTGAMYEHEERFRNGQTGEYRWFLARALPVRDGTGQIVKWFGTCTDIEEQKRTEKALRQSQKRIRALIDSNIIGIVSLEEEEEVVVEANDAYLRMTGYTQEDVRSRTLTRVKTTPPEQASIIERAIQELAERGQHHSFETEVVCKDGSRLSVLVGGVTFQDRPRQVISFVLDNSARKELEQRKDAFLSMASHELRNPLTALKLQTTLLHRQLAKQGIPASVPALSSMETQINKVTRLVEELLDVSKIQAGRLEYLQETVDLDALLREIADTMQQTHPSHRILVRGAVQASLIGDPDRLGQVFTNLLSGEPLRWTAPSG